jgi:hypothetical protein
MHHCTGSTTGLSIIQRQLGFTGGSLLQIYRVFGRWQLSLQVHSHKPCVCALKKWKWEKASDPNQVPSLRNAASFFVYLVGVRFSCGG